MGNSFFDFKQFRVVQENAAMKLGIDGVLLGALSKGDSPKKILDIGTGTGLLALMMAQKYPEARVDAVEIDKDACKDASHNFYNSGFNNRLHLHHCDIQHYDAGNELYDLILSNPPFFTEDIKPRTDSRSLARHHQSLNLRSLFSFCSNHTHFLSACWMVYPWKNRKDVFAGLIQHHLFIKEIYKIKHQEHSDVKRFVLHFGLGKTNDWEEHEIIIKDGNEYSAQYRHITKDFYLNF